MTASLSTLAPPDGSHGQAARTLTLPRVEPGVFVSTNLLLVSDAADASVDWPFTENGMSQRLFECELGGTVQAEYRDILEETYLAEAAVGVGVKTVTLDVFVMTLNGVPAASDFTVQRDIADAKERYAQADVKIQIGQITQVEMPMGITTNWYVEESIVGGKSRISQDAKRVLDALPRTPGHIGAVYVHGPLFSIDLAASIGENKSGVVGTSLPAYAFLEPADAGYLGNFFISSTHSATLFSVAHEGGHVLGLNVHPSLEPWNLMHEFGSTSKDAKQSKRLRSGQIQTIRGSPHVQ